MRLKLLHTATGAPAANPQPKTAEAKKARGPIAFGLLLRFVDIVLITKLGKNPAPIARLSPLYYGIFTTFSAPLFTALLAGGILMIPFLVIIGGLARSLRPAAVSRAC